MDLYVVCKEEITQCGDPQKLLASIDVYVMQAYTLLNKLVIVVVVVVSVHQCIFNPFQYNYFVHHFRFCGLLQFTECVLKKVLTQLMIFLCHKYPKVCDMVMLSWYNINKAFKVAVVIIYNILNDIVHFNICIMRLI